MRASLLFFVIACTASPMVAHADRAAAREADTLFREGKARLAAQDYLAACPLLAASFDKDPATGTLLALAVCRERQGDLVAALRAYREVVQRSEAEGRYDRRQAAQERVTALEALASEAKPAAPEPAPTVPATVAAPEAPEPEPAPEPVAVAQPIAAAEVVVAEPSPEIEAPAPSRTPSAARSRSDGITLLQGAGWATLGVGVFGLGTSLAFTLQAISKNNDSKDGCVVNRCTPQGASDRNDARASGTAATITGVIATALVAGGLAMVLFGGSSEHAPSTASASVAPLLLPDTVGAAAAGTF